MAPFTAPVPQKLFYYRSVFAISAANGKETCLVSPCKGKGPLTSFKAKAVSKSSLQAERKAMTCSVLCCLKFKLTNLAIVITPQIPDILNLPRERLQLIVRMGVTRGS